MSRKVGDFEWRQLSMWDFAPEHCIEKFVPSAYDKDTFHYYLTMVTGVMANDFWRIEVVVDPKIVPKEILEWRVPEWSKK
jgi:hypothetical protein